MAKDRPRSVIEDAQDDFVQVLQTLQKDTVGFSLLANLIKQVAGINMPLNDKNLSLMAGRLIAVLRKNDLFTYGDYHDFILANGAEALTEFLTRMTTNTTDFFREDAHFTLMKSLIPKLMETKKPPEPLSKKELRIWCAVCSSGQEAYTLAMTALESVPQKEKWDIKILASDIDVDVLQTAMAGVYTAQECKNIPPHLKLKYFSANEAVEETQLIASPALKKIIQFASFNLIQSHYPFKHPFDIIICRNVFIYFDRETQKQIINEFVKHISPDGYLFLGHSESGMVKQPDLKVISHSVYQKIKPGVVP